MIGQSNRWSTFLIVTLVIGLAWPAWVDARGGGRPRGHAPRPMARAAAAHHAASPHPSRMPHPNHNATGRARTNNANIGNHNVSRTNNTAARVANNANRVNSANRAGSLANRTPVSTSSIRYGTGSSARHYRARGYGRGYNNRYVGNRSYGRSQGSMRSIVSRLRSVHSSLARLDHDYQGHRIQSMHAISRAISQLSHRSINSRSFNSSMYGRNNAQLALINNRTQTNRAGNRNLNGQGRPRLSQAQSDTRMSQALRTTQGIRMQLAQQGSSSMGHVRAYNHLQHAVREMNMALAIR